MRVATDLERWRDGVPIAPMLAPLVGAASSRANPTGWDQRFGRYEQIAGSLFQMTSIEDAQVVVLPGDWYWVRGTSWSSRQDRDLVERMRPLYERAQELDKPVWVFFTGDRSCDRLPFPNASVFREGPFRSSMSPRDVPLPAFSEDLLAHYGGGVVAERTWSPRPTVGFCGLAHPKPAWRRAVGLSGFRLVVGARERRIDPSPYRGELLRAAAIELLRSSPGIDTNFVLRDRKVFFRDADSRDLDTVRREYVANLAGSDYVLCIRGSGNYSYRLYETLSMGRIPVIVDTDLALPRSVDVDWTTLGVWVDQRDLEELPDRILDFHSRLTPGDFLELQHQARRAWLRELSPEGFFTWLAGTDSSRFGPR